jgi:preprotein translocase subunit SecA
VPNTSSDLLLLPSRRVLARKTERAREPTKEEWDVVQQVKRRAGELEAARDGDLRDLAETLRDAAQRFESRMQPKDRLQQRIVGAALVREALRRTRGLRYHDVQLLAGLAMDSGQVVEMATGEGKTIVTAIPTFLAWLNGQQTQVATPNAYLAQRDWQQLQPVFEFLGVSAALLPESQNIRGKKAAYKADVVYGTGYEYGFDYLRDQLALRARPREKLGVSVLDSLVGRESIGQSMLQPRLQRTVVDEIDSVLIDEAMTPLILSDEGRGLEVPTPYTAARDLAADLILGRHFQVERAQRSIRLTEAGFDEIFAALKRSGLRDLRRPWDEFVLNALRAEHVLKVGVDYVLRDDEVQLVDQNTGRIFSDRSWRDGLHQAVEAFHHLAISREKSSSARITRQRFFQLYDALCGMTGTADGAEQEFAEFYGLKTLLIPRHRPCRRVDLPDRFFASKDAKLRAIVAEVLERHRCGQPVLIGTRTIADSELLSSMLQKLRLSHAVLNGLQDADEAAIIAQAGRHGAVTVATNMAGRGTDIKPDAHALAVGGLFVIGVERHDSTRVDRQLTGRAGRQGDFGFSRFFVSGDDDLLQRYAPQLARRLRKTAGRDGEVHDNYSPLVAQFQRLAEQQAFKQRRKMVEHDRWLDDVLAGVLGEEE